MTTYWARMREAMNNIPQESPYWEDTRYGRVLHFTEWWDNEFDPGRWAHPRPCSVNLGRQQRRHGKKWRARCKRWHD